MLCENYGGRVDLAKAYYRALTDSVKKHFKGNGVIASMEHCNDFMFLGTEAISLGRVGMYFSFSFRIFISTSKIKAISSSTKFLKENKYMQRKNVSGFHFHIKIGTSN